MPTPFSWVASRSASTQCLPAVPPRIKWYMSCACVPAARSTFLLQRAPPPARPWATSASGADLGPVSLRWHLLWSFERGVDRGWNSPVPRWCFNSTPSSDQHQVASLSGLIEIRTLLLMQWDTQSSSLESGIAQTNRQIILESEGTAFIFLLCLLWKCRDYLQN